MKDGFIKVAAVTPDIRVADCNFNSENIIKEMNNCAKKGVRIAVFPELVITGYTCGELFLQERLINLAKESLIKIIKETEKLDMLTFIGLPFELNGKLYNVAAVIKGGELLGIIPKINLPEYAELYEARYFTKGIITPKAILWKKNKTGFTYFGSRILFVNEEIKELKLAAEICEDLWIIIPPSNYHAMAGATIIANLSASPGILGKSSYRRNLVNCQSARLNAGYIYSTAGNGESSTDLVFSGQSLICENGAILKEKKRFENGMIISDIDVKRLVHERRRNTFEISENNDYVEVKFSFNNVEETKLDRKFPRNPFITEEASHEEAFNIQVEALKKRYEHTGSEYAIIGLSGGLDSTLSLLVTCETFDRLKIERKNIITVTMPSFGTTDRTYNNAKDLAKGLRTSLREISIRKAIENHLKDINSQKSITLENSQARERVQILMDLANEYGGLVIGTGDMSELALGYTTYNGDHMSMYNVNAGIPKTLVRELVRYRAKCSEEEISDILTDILNTPISPELLPTDGKMLQKTEEIVGPYELSDFFLYYHIRYGMDPDKILRMAIEVFKEEYSEEEIEKWQKSFYRRFFANQYKRSCVPDGPKVTQVSLSPRGDLKMPSDAKGEDWFR